MDASACGPSGEPLLGVAIEAGRLDWVEALTAAKADGSAKDRQSLAMIPKAFACFKREADFVAAARLLAGAGASPSAKDAYGTPMLAKAMERSWGDALGELLRLGANAKASNAQEEPMLGVALTVGGQVALGWLAMLASSGADGAARDRNGRGMMTKSLSAFKSEALWMEGARALASIGASYDAKDAYGLPTLIALMKNGWGDAAKQALWAGAKPNLADSGGNRPLAVAIDARRVDWVEMLVAAGADASGKDAHEIPWGHKALKSMQSEADFIACWAALAAGGAKPDLKDPYGKPLLVSLVERGWLSAGLAVLGCGARVGLRDAQGKSALDCAAESGLAHWAQALLAAGADPEAKDSRGVKASAKARAPLVIEAFAQAALGPKPAPLPSWSPDVDLAALRARLGWGGAGSGGALPGQDGGSDAEREFLQRIQLAKQALADASLAIKQERDEDQAARADGGSLSWSAPSAAPNRATYKR